MSRVTVRFPREEFDKLVDLVMQHLEDMCNSDAEVELLMTGLVLTILKGYELDVDDFSKHLSRVHIDALASMNDVNKLLKKFMKGESDDGSSTKH